MPHICTRCGKAEMNEGAVMATCPKCGFQIRPYQLNEIPSVTSDSFFGN